METPPVTPAPTPLPGEPKKNNTTLIIIIVAVVVLCCCCVGLGLAYQYGDAIMQSLNY